MNKKIKLFLAKDYLDWREAVEMFRHLTETEATPNDFVALVRKYKTPVYSCSYPNGLPCEDTYHEDSPNFLAYGSYSEKEAAIYCDFGSGGSAWIDNEGIIHSNLAHFKPVDIENLAAKINGKPFIQEELEQLRQRVAELEEENKNLKEAGAVAGGLVFSYSTPELEAMQKAANKFWRNYDPIKRPPSQKEVGYEIAELLELQPQGNGSPPRLAGQYATAIKPEKYR